MYDIDPIKIVAGAVKSAPTTTDNTLAQNKSVVNSIISKKSENDTEMRKSVNDSNGKKLSEQQAEYFKDSKVRDEEGNLLVVYHGTRKADFTVFNRNYNFFTDNKNTAESYAPESEMFEGYLNISKPYIIDAKDNKWSAIPVDEETKTMLDNYGSSTFKENGQWMTSPADIVAAILDGIDEGEFYYDGVIIKNVEDTGNWGENEKTIGNDYIVFNSNQFKNIDNLNPTENEDIRYSISKNFEKEYDEWDKNNTNVVFTLGTTSSALKSIGIKDQSIQMRSGMILQKVNKHNEITFDTFRQIPDLLENPIVIQFSDAIDPRTHKQKYDSRITVLGELYADMIVNDKTEQKPVLVSLELLPYNQKNTAILDLSVITSAYGHAKLQQYLNENSILYVNPDKKRTNNWLSLNRLQLPLGDNQFGSIKKITYSGNKVKIENSKNATPMQLALEKAGMVDSFGNSISEKSENDTTKENSDIRFSKNENDFIKTYSQRDKVVTSLENRLKKRYTDITMINNIPVEFDNIEVSGAPGSYETFYIKFIVDETDGFEIRYSGHRNKYGGYDDVIWNNDVHSLTELYSEVDKTVNGYMDENYTKDGVWKTKDNGLRFSKNTKYNEFKTFSMQWANSADTKDGDMKIFNRRGKEFVLLEKSGNDIIEVAKGSYRKVRNIYEQTYGTTTDRIYEHSQNFRGRKRNDTWDKFDVGDRGYGNGDDRQTGSKGLQTDGEGNGTDLLSGDKGELRKSLNNTEMI